ncbi:MAG: hypothetical protein U0930_03040 [Pirellulales bacterium]
MPKLVTVVSSILLFVFIHHGTAQADTLKLETALTDQLLRLNQSTLVGKASFKFKLDRVLGTSTQLPTLFLNYKMGDNSLLSALEKPIAPATTIAAADDFNFSGVFSGLPESSFQVLQNSTC